MRKVIYIALLIVLSNFGLRAQQRPQYSQYMVNQLMVNPAVVGSQNLEEIKIGGRIQWVGFESAPQTYFATYNTPFKKIPWKTTSRQPGHHGLGAVLIKDITGPVSQTSVQMNYAYHHPFTNKISASVGASVGVMQHTIAMDQLKFQNQNDPIIDRLLTNQILPDASVGLWVYSSKFYVGVSITQLVSSSSIFLPTGEREVEVFDLNAHYFANVGYRIDVGNPSEGWFLVPSVMFKSVKPARGHFDLNLMAQKNSDVWFGVSFRQDDSFSGLVGFSAGDPFSFTYSYDYIISSIGPFSGGSHELTMSFKFKRQQKKIYCPESFWH